MLVILLVSLVVASCSQVLTLPHNPGAAALSMQVTPPPPAEDKSEIGSTEGIFIMGLVIVAITSLPILLRRKKK